MKTILKQPKEIRLSSLFATGFYSGLVAKAPGTSGSLAYAALFIIISLIFGPLPNLILFLMSVFVTTLGLWSVSNELKLSNYRDSDPQYIVIDEWAGLAVAFCALNLSALPYYPSVAILFVLFRFFDITKIWPINAAEQVAGTLGIMLDDILAGLFAALLFLVISYFI